MHCLHRILVKIRESDLLDEDYSRDELIHDARYRAEEGTEEFCGQVFDWRTTDTAGRWIHRYPENVLLAKEDLEKFLRELEICRDSQEEEKVMALEELGKYSLDLEELKEMDANGETLPLYYLKDFSDLMYGTYTFDSMFYDTDDYSSKITDNTFEKIKESPDKWALVFFDYHN